MLRRPAAEITLGPVGSGVFREEEVEHCHALWLGGRPAMACAVPAHLLAAESSEVSLPEVI